MQANAFRARKRQNTGCNRRRLPLRFSIASVADLQREKGMVSYVTRQAPNALGDRAD